MLSGEHNTGCSASNMMQPEVASKHLDVMAVPPSILKGRRLQNCAQSKHCKQTWCQASLGCPTCKKL